MEILIGIAVGLITGVVADRLFPAPRVMKAYIASVERRRLSLLLVPSEMREPPNEYAEDDDHPELYPPAFAVAQK